MVEGGGMAYLGLQVDFERLVEMQRCCAGQPSNTHTQMYLPCVCSKFILGGSVSILYPHSATEMSCASASADCELESSSWAPWTLQNSPNLHGISGESYDEFGDISNEVESSLELKAPSKSTASTLLNPALLTRAVLVLRIPENPVTG